MRERVNDLLQLMGLEANSVQTLEGERGSYTLLYPNYFSTRDEDKHPKTDEELLLQIEDIISETYLGVKKELEMVRRFRKELEGVKTSSEV